MVRVTEKSSSHRRDLDRLLEGNRAPIFFTQKGHAPPPTTDAAPIYRAMLVHPRHLHKFFNFCCLPPKIVSDHLHLIMELDIPFSSLTQSAMVRGRAWVCPAWLRPAELGASGQSSMSEMSRVPDSPTEMAEEVGAGVLESPRRETEEEEQEQESLELDQGPPSGAAAAATAAPALPFVTRHPSALLGVSAFLPSFPPQPFPRGGGDLPDDKGNDTVIGGDDDA